MSSNKAVVLDKRELERYIKFLALKYTQVIVQSRLGEKITTECNSAQQNWFNIAIQDQTDVLLETKRVLSLLSGEPVTSKLPLCVEISLETVEGDKMILEVWSLNVTADQNEPTLKANYAIYNAMGILLKSLIAATRATPAYKLSRKQSTDSFNIYYRIYTGEPHIHNLGEGFKQVRVGHLNTTVGSLNMSVAYRTKMTISPTQTGRDNKIMLKSDHFLKDLSPKNIRHNNANKKQNERRVTDLDKPMKPGAFVDPTKVKQFNIDDFFLAETPPFSWLLKHVKDDRLSISSKSDEESHPNLSTKTDISMNNNTVLSKNSNETATKSESPPTSVANSRWRVPPEDDPLLKELVFPFATQNTPINDLAKFYRDCYHAPPLQEFSQIQVEKDAAVDDLTKQLEQFESSLGDYDSLLKSIQSLDNNSNS